MLFYSKASFAFFPTGQCLYLLLAARLHRETVKAFAPNFHKISLLLVLPLLPGVMSRSASLQDCFGFTGLVQYMSHDMRKASLWGFRPGPAQTSLSVIEEG